MKRFRNNRFDDGDDSFNHGSRTVVDEEVDQKAQFGVAAHLQITEEDEEDPNVKFAKTLGYVKADYK